MTRPDHHETTAPAAAIHSTEGDRPLRGSQRHAEPLTPVVGAITPVDPGSAGSVKPCGSRQRPRPRADHREVTVDHGEVTARLRTVLAAVDAVPATAAGPHRARCHRRSTAVDQGFRPGSPPACTGGPPAGDRTGPAVDRSPTLTDVSTLHAAPPTPSWAQAAADAAAYAADGAEAPLTLPDGTAAVLMSKSRAAHLHDQVDGLLETRQILRSRRSRSRLVRGLADLAAGRTHDAAAAAAALARHPGRR